MYVILLIFIDNAHCFLSLQVPPWPEIWNHESRSRRQSQTSVTSLSSGGGNVNQRRPAGVHLSLAPSTGAILLSDDQSYNVVDKANNYVIMDKSILKVHLPNGGFNVVKCGDATDIRVSKIYFKT